jgi:hypothetical protein
MRPFLKLLEPSVLLQHILAGSLSCGSPPVGTTHTSSTFIERIPSTAHQGSSLVLVQTPWSRFQHRR